MKKIIVVFLAFLKKMFSREQSSASSMLNMNATNTKYLSPSILSSVPSIPRLTKRAISKARRKNNRANTPGRLTQRIGRKTIKHFS